MSFEIGQRVEVTAGHWDASRRGTRGEVVRVSALHVRVRSDDGTEFVVLTEDARPVETADFVFDVMVKSSQGQLHATTTWQKTYSNVEPDEKPSCDRVLRELWNDIRASEGLCLPMERDGRTGVAFIPLEAIMAIEIFDAVQ